MKNQARSKQGKRAGLMAGLTTEQRALVAAELERIIGRENPTKRAGYNYEGWSLFKTPSTGTAKYVSLLKRDSNGRITQAVHLMGMQSPRQSAR